MPTGTQITDRDSFDKVTAGDNGVAALYFFQQLDCLDRLAYKVAADFFNRPQHYTAVDRGDTGGPPLREILARFHARAGHDEFFPSNAQRDQIFLAIFGRGGDESAPENGDFPQLRDALLCAATKYAERAVDSGVDMLLDRVKAATRPLNELLTGTSGDSTIWSRSVLAKLAEDISYRILRSTAVAVVFGIEKAPPSSWPYALNPDGTKLVEAVCAQLADKKQPSQYPLSRQLFSDLQWTALSGAEALARVIEFRETSSNADVLQLTNTCYTWAAALSSLNSSLAHHPAKHAHAPGDAPAPAPPMTAIPVYGAPRAPA